MYLLHSNSISVEDPARSQVSDSDKISKILNFSIGIHAIALRQSIVVPVIYRPCCITPERRSEHVSTEVLSVGEID
jgi:hypothetical protein